MKKIKSTTNLTINGTTSKQGANKAALRQVTLQGLAIVILAIGISSTDIAYLISQILPFFK